ncbi:alpha/beta hydrolase [Sphaerotilus sp.]|uniref:alpha/beta fold hydrolase n=1 Tax=Sphaerotilus sp. TaxID=2093942 RepID=UPI00286EB33B|nr:alpha/beta hydrolase [Sphaerotilus sp.]
MSMPTSAPLYAYTGGRPFDAALPCVVFLHGALHDHSVWTLAARWFAHHGHSVLAVDLPGHGRSAGPALPDIEAMADAVLALLAERGVRRAALVGHSMGSLIALEAASRAAPGTVSHLVLVGTAYPMRVSPALLDTAARQPLVAIDQVVTFSHASMAAKPSYPGPGAWLHGVSRALMRQVLARSEGVAGVEHNLFHHDFSACDRYAHGLDAAAQLQGVRCSLIVGARDRMTVPKQATAMAKALGAEVHTLPTAGHVLMMEDPDGLLAALRTALA